MVRILFFRIVPRFRSTWCNRRLSSGSSRIWTRNQFENCPGMRLTNFLCQVKSSNSNSTLVTVLVTEAWRVRGHTYRGQHCVTAVPTSILLFLTHLYLWSGRHINSILSVCADNMAKLRQEKEILLGQVVQAQTESQELRRQANTQVTNINNLTGNLLLPPLVISILILYLHVLSCSLTVVSRCFFVSRQSPLHLSSIV